MTIGNASKMIDTGSWQTFPQPHLPYSYNDYVKLFQIGFQYQSFKFIGEFIKCKHNKETCWFVYPFTKTFKNKILLFSDKVKQNKYWQRDIYNISIKNKKLQNILDTFRECNIFYANDLCRNRF